MATPDKLEAVKKVSETLSKQQATSAEEFERVAPNREQFETLFDSAKPSQVAFQRVSETSVAPESIQSTEKNPIFAEENVSSQKSGSAADQEQKRRGQQEPVEEIEETSATGSKASGTLMEEVQRSNHASSTQVMSSDELKKRTTDLIGQIDRAKTQLSQASGIKPGYQTQLRNHLTHIDDNLKIALSKAGGEYTPPAKTTDLSTHPVGRFLNYLTNSQHHLTHLEQTIDQLSLSKTELSPANMLALQIKVGQVQHQMELFSSLLNKALESTKTIMNVQV